MRKTFWFGYLAGIGTCIFVAIFAVVVMSAQGRVSLAKAKDQQKADIGGWVENDVTEIKASLDKLNEQFPDWRSAEDVHKVEGLWSALIDVKHKFGTYEFHVDFYNMVMKEEPLEREQWIADIAAALENVLSRPANNGMNADQ